MAVVAANRPLFGNMTASGAVASFACQVPTDPFGALRVVHRTSVVDIKSTFGISGLRDVVTTAGTGTVTNTVGNAEYTLAVSAANDSAVLRSSQRGLYVSGYGAEMGMAVRLAQGTYTGAQRARWGYFDGTTDGLYFVQSASGLGVAYMRAGVETIVPRASWNVDRLDGTGPSGAVVDVTKGNIWQIVFSWYGYGSIAWKVVLTDASGMQVVQVVHRYAPTGQTSIVVPNQPITLLLESNATAGALTAYVAGRQFSVLAQNPYPVLRVTSCYNTLTAIRGSTAPNWVPLITVRRKTGYLGNPIKVSSIDLLQSTDCLYEVRVNATLTGASFGPSQDTPAAETALEFDTSATAMSGGTTIASGLSPAGIAMLIQTDDLVFSLNELATVTLGVWAITNRSTGTVTAVLRMSEAW
jgi:hypothetical protein